MTDPVDLVYLGRYRYIYHSIKNGDGDRSRSAEDFNLLQDTIPELIVFILEEGEWDSVR